MAKIACCPPTYWRTRSSSNSLKKIIAEICLAIFLASIPVIVEDNALFAANNRYQQEPTGAWNMTEAMCIT